VEDLQRLWSPTLSSHGVTFALEAPEPCVLHVDRKQMEQLFINLVNNSVDAMPDGGHLALAVEPDPEGPRWLVSLADNGLGIPAEVLPKVFRPMFTTKPDGKGTGLGLAICREIVRAHGGEIQIQSEEGRGTTMRFPLPAMP
jgi:signal transduction histidine kinase